MPYEVRLTIYIVTAVFLAAALFLLFFLTPIRKHRARKDPCRLFYRKIRSIVLDHDFYLINKVKMEEGGYTLSVDHLVGGDKFIYLIFDLYCEGGISFEMNDRKWIVYEKKGKRYIDNPLEAAEGTLGKLSARSGIDPSFFVAIVAVNDDCFLSPFENRSQGPYLVPLSRLRETIERIESRPEHPLEKDELKQTIRDFYTLYKENNG